MSMTFYTMALKNVELSITNALFETAPIFAFFIDAVVSKVQINLISGNSFYKFRLKFLKLIFY
jgi:hypothetical protein